MQIFSVFPFPNKHADMQIYRNFVERVEESYDGYYVCFVDMLKKPILPSKQQKKLYNVTISTGPTGGEVL